MPPNDLVSRDLVGEGGDESSLMFFAEFFRYHSVALSYDVVQKPRRLYPLKSTYFIATEKVPPFAFFTRAFQYKKIPVC
jgi:hypothetical protein